MAMAKMSVAFNLILVLCLVLMISIAESRQLAVGFGKHETALSCVAVYGAEEGDTCESVIEKFQLTSDLFLAINPNINCNDFFVGQWLCTDGTFN